MAMIMRAMCDRAGLMVKTIRWGGGCVHMFLAEAADRLYPETSRGIPFTGSAERPIQK
jgi:hypothetical protein